jgi:NAD(P)H-nitrite reductase large subunit
MNFLIIGNSAAGTAAIEAIRKHDNKSSITQLSNEAQPLYSRCLLSYYLAGTREKEGLLFRGRDFHNKMKVQLHGGPEFRALSLNPSKQNVTCQNGKIFHYDRLLIATGASAKLPQNIPGGIGGIFMLRDLADAEAIKTRIPQVNRAVVLGGGLIGIKAATALSRSGIKTTLIMRSNRVLSQMIDFDAARIISMSLEENNIDIMHQTNIVEIESSNGTLTGVKTDRGDRLDCGLMIVAKGVKPNTEILRETGIAVPWGIETDAYMQTSAANIYAAGDVAETFDITLESHAVNALWTSAMQQGRVAGLNMAGQQTAYDGTLGMNSLNVYNTSIISFGISSPKDETQYKALVLNQPELGIYKKIVIGNDNRIKGIILVGRIENAGVLLSLIRRKIDVSQFEEELLSDRFNFGKILKHSDPAELERYYNRQLR